MHGLHKDRQFIYTGFERKDMDAVAFAYYFLMLAIGLKIVHAFYSYFKNKKRTGSNAGKANLLSLFDRENDDSEQSKKTSHSKNSE